MHMLLEGDLQRPKNAAAAFFSSAASSTLLRFRRADLALSDE
ncbi:MAG: hypothetical protein Q7S69_06810 [Nitrosomonadaceae bacterium]|nr:hypothetical protein [Nitrosomonadaceae bacterium]